MPGRSIWASKQLQPLPGCMGPRSPPPHLHFPSAALQSWVRFAQVLSAGKVTGPARPAGLLAEGAGVRAGPASPFPPCLALPPAGAAGFSKSEPGICRMSPYTDSPCFPLSPYQPFCSSHLRGGAVFSGWNTRAIRQEVLAICLLPAARCTPTAHPFPPQDAGLRPINHSAGAYSLGNQKADSNSPSPT